FLNAGFYRVLQPRSVGGYGFSMTDFARLLIEIARGCMDSGWVLSLIASQPATVLPLFSEAAQRGAYKAGGDCRAGFGVMAGRAGGAGGRAGVGAREGRKSSGRRRFCGIRSGGGSGAWGVGYL